MLKSTPCFICVAAMMTLSVSSDRISDVIVNTKYGPLRGNRVRQDYGLGRDAVSTVIDRFLGVPFAKPPVGEWRFKEPTKPDSWGRTVRDAIDHGPSCPQMIWGSDNRLNRQDEDCLYMDIYSPFKEYDRHARYPVMVYIHGGSYEVGAGRLVDGSVLAQLGVVLVTINYRLGALGFMTSGDSYLPGNYGLLDQIEALRWVHENIHVFRGDTSKVTIFGHSVGAASVGLLMIMPQAEGLFHNVISQSGVATAPYSVHYPSDGSANFTDYVLAVGRLFDCNYEKVNNSLIDCLRTVSWNRIVDDRPKFPLFHPINPEFRPIVDGHVITDLPSKMFKSGTFLRVPFIIGTVRDEFGNYFSGGERYRVEFDAALDSYVKGFLHEDERLFEVVKFQYTNWANKSKLYDYERGDVLSDMHMFAPTMEMADMIAGHTDEIYQYHFSTPGSSYHSIELNYVFGAPFSGMFADEMTINGTVDKFNAAERQLSLDMMKLWINFAKTGRPVTPSDNIKPWQPYSLADKEYLLLSADGSTMDRQLRASYAAFWNQLIPSVTPPGKFRTGCSRVPTVTTVVGMWTLLAMTVVLLILVAILTVVLVRREILARRRRRRGYAAGAASKASKNCNVAK